MHFACSVATAGASAIVVPRDRFAPVKKCSDLDSSASALAAATESYTVGSDPAFWSNSVSFPADMQTVVVGTKLIFNYSDSKTSADYLLTTNPRERAHRQNLYVWATAVTEGPARLS
mgnify:CR=1 FL=1